jgi:hypothetical protein
MIADPAFGITPEKLADILISVTFTAKFDNIRLLLCEIVGNGFP